MPTQQKSDVLVFDLWVQNHEDPHQLVNYGVDWLGKIQQLERRKLIRLDNLLLAYQPPKDKLREKKQAFEEAYAMLMESGVQMEKVTDEASIAKFAQNVEA